MAINYTQDQVEYIVNQYRLSPTRETVEELAEELEKSIKSIIGKPVSYTHLTLPTNREV